MSDINKAREAVGRLLDYPHQGHGVWPAADMPRADAIIALVRAIIADHEEQQLHEAMHGPIADPLPKDGVEAGEDVGDLHWHLLGRARFLRDRKEVKSPELLEQAARELRARDRRIAELERERDEAREAANHNAMLYGQSEISAARLRKAVEDVRDVAVKNGVPGTDKEWALRYVARRLDAALQPEPGTVRVDDLPARDWDEFDQTKTPRMIVDPQPARGEDSPVSVLGPPFEFDRYINGKLMAEGVTIEREPTLDRAVHVAARIASRGPNGEPPVLVYRSPSPDLVKARVAKACDASLKEPHQDSPVSALACYECNTPLMGPYCPKCDPRSPSPALKDESRGEG